MGCVVYSINHWSDQVGALGALGALGRWQPRGGERKEREVEMDVLELEGAD